MKYFTNSFIIFILSYLGYDTLKLKHSQNKFCTLIRSYQSHFTQKNVTGTVTVTLKPYYFSLDGIESEHDLMNSKFGQYGEINNAWTADDAKGFIKILGNAQSIYSQVNSIDYD